MNNTEFIKKLLNLSDLIINEIYVLSELSFYEKEYTDEFIEHVGLFTNYIVAEGEILNKFSLEELIELSQVLPNYDDNTEAYERLSCSIDNLIDEYPTDKEDEYHEDFDIDTQLDDIIEEFNKNRRTPMAIDQYYVDESDTERYSTQVMDRIAGIAIKEMPQRIRKTFADNDQDNKFKLRLLQEFNNFKYSFFTLDNRLERIGCLCRFDIAKMPIVENVDGDISAISHNQCVNILDKIYSVKTDETDLEKLNEVLFNMICFEEYLKNIPDKSVDVLLLLCQELETVLGKRLYGSLAQKRLVLKKENR